MKALLFCDCCGRLVRVYGEAHCFYTQRWFDKRLITLCEDCEDLFPEETEKDKPERAILM